MHRTVLKHSYVFLFALFEIVELVFVSIWSQNLIILLRVAQSTIECEYVKLILCAVPTIN